MEHDPRFLRADAVTRSGKRKKRNYRLIVLVTIFLFTLAGGLSYLAYQYIVESDTFVLNRLVIENTVFADKSSVESIVYEKCSGNMLTVNLRELCSAVEQLPWVEKVQARKNLPDTLYLDILESRPRAFLALAGTLMLVDKNGIIIDEVKPEYPFKDLPLITGIENIDEESRVIELVNIVKILEEIRDKRPDWYLRTEEVNLLDQRSCKIYFQDAKGPVIVDKTAVISSLSRYFLIEALLQQRYDSVEYFDTRFDRRLFVKASGN